FAHAFLQAGIRIGDLEENENVRMYVSNIGGNRSGEFKGNIRVSMRGMRMREGIKGREIRRGFKNVDGRGIEIGNGREIGMTEVGVGDLGEPVSINENEVGV
ncbi:D-glutamate cyclase family protein, partial [Staphylococcus saprophyticus]|uniref:D-glutamate cyclase family protein n=1 Tax=Staphylococcus saprophyticus TaxID=29385 RepID=UPI0011AAF3A4